MTPIIVTTAVLAALFCTLAFATVPPRLVPWPARRNVRTDVSMLRVYLAHRVSHLRTQERDEERETVRQLREKARELEGKNAKLTADLRTARTRVYALQEMALPEALAVVAAHRDREAGGEGSGGEDETGQIGGAPPPVFKP